MNQTINSIMNRRSVRKFTDTPVEIEKVRAIVDAGLMAPSAHNQQSWHFAVIQDKEILNEINVQAKEAAKAIEDKVISRIANNPKANIFYNAPTVIIVSGDTSSMMPEVDCAAATQNMLITAESLGLKTCWVGMTAFLFGSEVGEKYKEKLQIPKTHAPYYAVAIGYNDNLNPKAPARREGTVSYI